jgi:hypothetical protein
MPQNSLFNLKIMKLFLLNTMENKKSRKIGLTILGFFYNFLQFPKASLKKKRKRLNSTGPVSAQAAQVHAETRARPRGRLCRRALRVLANWRWVRSLLTESLTVCRKDPIVLILRRGRSPTASRAAELRRACRPAGGGQDWCSASA